MLGKWEHKVKKLELSDIKPGTWLVNNDHTPRYRLIYCSGDVRTMSSVSDTGYMMYGPTSPDDLFDFYSNDNWSVVVRK
jgi:hypothetical protein